jgi:hypothetical protein
MKKQLTTALIWVFSLIFMLMLAVYQRMTGPTHPLRGKVELNGETYKYKFLRSHDTGIDAPFEMEVPEGAVAIFRYKRFKSFDEWTAVEVKPENGVVKIAVPSQPPAGKVEYQVALLYKDKSYPLTDEPVIIRYKGSVPGFVLIPHIIFMFLAMVLSVRTGIEALLNRTHIFRLTSITLLFLFLGGLVFGPIVQKYAFDAYWTGWPWGTDLTDNKTIVAFIFWLTAWIVLYRRRRNRIWPVLAMVVMLAAYLIPHSMLGSELDFRELEAEKMEQKETSQ